MVELIRSRTLHLAILMFLLYIISVRKNTKSHFDWLLHFTSGRRREKFFVIVDRQDGLFHPVHISLSNVKLNSSSVLQNCSLFSPSPALFIAVRFSENEKGTFGRKNPHVFYKDHRGSSSKHYPYIQKQASKRPQPNPCGLDVNVLNDENVITLFLMFLKTLLSSLVADFAALEKTSS